VRRLDLGRPPARAFVVGGVRTLRGAARKSNL
jgi:hypothetical protein